MERQPTYCDPHSYYMIKHILLFYSKYLYFVVWQETHTTREGTEMTRKSPQPMTGLEACVHRTAESDPNMWVEQKRPKHMAPSSWALTSQSPTFCHHTREAITCDNWTRRSVPPKKKKWAACKSLPAYSSRYFEAAGLELDELLPGLDITCKTLNCANLLQRQKGGEVLHILHSF